MYSIEKGEKVAGEGVWWFDQSGLLNPRVYILSYRDTELHTRDFCLSLDS